MAPSAGYLSGFVIACNRSRSLFERFGEGDPAVRHTTYFGMETLSGGGFRYVPLDSFEVGMVWLNGAVADPTSRAND